MVGAMPTMVEQYISGSVEHCLLRRGVHEENRRMNVTWEELDTLDSSGKTIAILGDIHGRWRPQTAKQEGDKTNKEFLCNNVKKT